MSTFGGSSGGMTPGNFGPGSGYAPDGVSSQPFGDFYQMLQNQANTPNQLPDGYAYNPATGKAQEQGVGFYGTTNSMHFDPMGTQGITGTQQVMGAAMGDFNNLNAANDFNYGNRVDANNQFLQGIMGGAQDIRDAGQTAQGQMFDFAKGLQQQGDNFFAGQEARVDEAIDGFQDLSAQQASAMSRGLAQQNKSRRQEMDALAKLGDPQALGAISEFEMQEESKQAQTMTSLATQFNQGLSSMRMQGIGALSQAGGIQQGYNQMASNMNQMGVSIANSAEAQAANFEAQGLGQYAQMVASNPYNPVAFLPTLMSFFQFSETPGASNFSGFDPAVLGMQTT